MNFEIKIKTKNLILGAFLGLFIFALGPVPQAQANHNLDLAVTEVTIAGSGVIIIGQPVKILVTASTDNSAALEIAERFQAKICAGGAAGVTAIKEFDGEGPCIIGRQVFLVDGGAGNAQIVRRESNRVLLSIDIPAAQNRFADSDTGFAVAIKAVVPLSRAFDHDFVGVSETYPVTVLSSPDDQDEKEDQNNIGLTVTRQRGGNSFNYTARLNGTPINPSTAAVVKDGVSIPPCACTLQWFYGRSGSRTEATGDFNKNPAEFVVEKDVVTVRYRPNNEPGKFYEASALGIKTDQQTASPGDGDSGNPIIGAIAAIIGVIVNLIITVVGQITTILLIPIMRALLSIQVHDAQFASIIVSGWVIVRNIANIFFMLALILISLATLFQVEKYNYKHLLVQVVFMALLVNFSLVIARAILGIADTIQAQFIPFGNPDVINNLAHHLIVKANMTTYSFTEILNGSFSMVVQPVFHLIFALGAFAAFAAITAFLLIRIIAIMLLLVTSPFAYVGRIFGAGQASSISSKWWSEFLKYAFFTPILAFFLKLCALIAIQTAALGPAVIKVYPQSSSPVFAQFVYNNLSNVLIIACLFAGLHFAKSQHVAFGDQILDKAKKFAGAPARWAGQGAAFGAGATRDFLQRQKDLATLNLAKSDEEGASTGQRLKGKSKRLLYRALNPKASTEAWLERTGDKNTRASALQKAAARNVSYAAATRGVVDLQAVRDERTKQESADVSRISEETWEEMEKRIGKIKSTGFGNTSEGKKEMRALYSAAVKTGKIRKLVEDRFKDPKTKKPGKYNEKNFYKMLEEDLKNDPQAPIFKKGLGKLGKENFKLMFVGAENDEAGRKDEQEKWLDGLTADDLEKVNAVGIEKVDSAGNISKVQEKFAKKYAENAHARMSLNTAKHFGAAYIREADGQMVFQSVEDKAAFDQLPAKLQKRVYNSLVGVTNMDRSEFVREVQPGFVDVDAATNATDYIPAGTSIARDLKAKGIGDPPVPPTPGGGGGGGGTGGGGTPTGGTGPTPTTPSGGGGGAPSGGTPSGGSTPSSGSSGSPSGGSAGPSSGPGPTTSPTPAGGIPSTPPPSTPSSSTSAGTSPGPISRRDLLRGRINPPLDNT